VCGDSTPASRGLPDSGQTLNHAHSAVAYAVAMLTQQAERSNHRSPWHLLASFELSDWVDHLDPGLDEYHVEMVLHRGILVIRDALDPTAPE
jgi:hypothetical protein